VHLIFGDGRQGLRLPSGQENVVATYRVGTGLEGEVEAGSLTLMQNKPLGVESVTNPLKAAGAAPPDTIETARRKAPLAVATLERLVSLQDFAAFAMTFAGIGKVQVARLWDSHTRVIHLTVLGADQQAVLSSSELYRSLQRGIAARAAPQQTVLVQSGQELIQRFNVEARVLVEPGYQVAPIREAIRTVLQRTFAFDQRTFGQSVAASDVITLMQQVRGVRAVELTALYGASETATLQLLLRATLARWDSLNKVFEPAQLLVINNDGITLTLENVDE
jgi:predicted phage baseplate assembly protein